MNNKTIIVTMGLALSRKSVLAKELSVRTGIPFIDVDDYAALGVPPPEPDPYGSDAARERQRKRMAASYAALHAMIAAKLEVGRSLIVSASYTSRSSQEFLRQAVQENGGKLKVIFCTFDDSDSEVALRAQNDPRLISQYYEDKKRHGGTGFPHITVNTSENFNAVVEKALTYVNRK